MRRTLAQRQPHLDFAAAALHGGYQVLEILRLLCEKFGLSTRQARFDVKFVLVCLHREGKAVLDGDRETEDLSLTLRRLEQRYRDALAKDDFRTAFKAEKARARLLGLYPGARQTAEEKEKQLADERDEEDDVARLAHVRRKLRQAERSGAAESPATAETGLAPPTNIGHEPNCPCWQCNPEFQAEREGYNRRRYPDWQATRQAAVAELLPLLPKWRARNVCDNVDSETDEQFAARIERDKRHDTELLEVEGIAALRASQPPEVEQRLAALTKWLELGISREACRRRYQVKFALPTRRLNAEWRLCLKRFDDEGRWLKRRRNEKVALALGRRRRDDLTERSLTSGDYKLALDIEIDLVRYLGLFPKQRRPQRPLSPREREAILRANLDHLDPAGHGTGIPTPREAQLIARLG